MALPVPQSGVHCGALVFVLHCQAFIWHDQCNFSAVISVNVMSVRMALSHRCESCRTSYEFHSSYVRKVSCFVTFPSTCAVLTIRTDPHDVACCSVCESLWKEQNCAKTMQQATVRLWLKHRTCIGFATDQAGVSKT